MLLLDMVRSTLLQRPILGWPKAGNGVWQHLFRKCDFRVVIRDSIIDILMREARDGHQKVEWGEFYHIDPEMAVRLLVLTEISMWPRLSGWKNDDFIIAQNWHVMTPGASTDHRESLAVICNEFGMRLGKLKKIMTCGFEMTSPCSKSS